MLLSTLILTTLWHYVSLSHCVSFNKIRTVKVNSILFRGNDFIIYLLLYDVLYGICVCVKSQQFKHSPSMTCIHLSSPTHPENMSQYFVLHCIIEWVYLSIYFVVKCLHGFYDISYDILPKPSSRRAHYLTFTHEFARTNCLKYCCLHVLPRFWNTLPRPITELCIDISVYPFLNTLRNFLFGMPPITQSFWFCCIKI